MATIAASPPTWTDTYNTWFANEYLPWINSVQGTNVKASDLTVGANGAIIPNAAIPLWDWNTGGDTAAQKAVLDQRYLDSVAAYNQANNTNISPNTAVLGSNVQPNTTYRAPDEGGLLSGVTGVLGGAADLVGSAVNSVGNFVTNHPLEAAALVAGGYYFAPEIGAWISPAGEAVAGTESGATLAGNADKAALLSDAGYGAGMTGAETAAYDAGLAAGAGTGAAAGAGAAAAGGLTAANVIKALPLVPVVNQLVGDPLNLNPTPEPAAAANTGYEIVPIPSNWTSPVYQTNQAPLDLNSIFTTNDLLQGTQWQNLKNQRNMSFNDIFASGQQSTPMGNPVNINNLVSAILGQTPTS